MLALSSIPDSVRYVKNGPGGQWWKTAHAQQQIHAGWADVPAEILRAGDLAAAKPYVEQIAKDPGAATRDYNALRALIDRPSQHVWITFEDRRMWWCTARDRVETSPEGATSEHGHFWLACQREWSDRSIDGQRQLFTSELPGAVTTVAGFRGTVCEPRDWKTILRVIRNEPEPKVLAAQRAREAYESAIADLIGQLGPKDFELLIDLTLARDGWVRIGPLGGSMADIDTEVENRSANEIAFVQVKSAADQASLDLSIAKFRAQRDRYARVIFAVHDPRGDLRAPPELPVQIWNRERIAGLVVRLGLAGWLEKRL
jgi:hypothetical protein